MADWTDIANTQVDPGSPVDTALMTALRDNPTAIADGAVGAPRTGLTLINTTVITGSPTVVDFTAFDATLYASYIFMLEDVKIPTSRADLWLRASSDGGVTFDNGVSDYSIFGPSAGDGTDIPAAQVIMVSGAEDDYGVLGKV